ARWPQKREELALADIERDAIDGGAGAAAIALHQPLEADMRPHLGRGNRKGGGARRAGDLCHAAHDPVFTLVQARVRWRSYCGVTGLSKNSRARTSCEG